MGITASYYKVSENDFLKIIKNEHSLSCYDKNDYLDIDKSWDALLFILMGEGISQIMEKEPSERGIISKAILGENLIYKEDSGYENGTYISNVEVQKCNEELKKITKNEFEQKFDFDKMEKLNIYPIISGENKYDFFDYIFIYFEVLKNFFELASKENKYILIFIH